MGIKETLRRIGSCFSARQAVSANPTDPRSEFATLAREVKGDLHNISRLQAENLRQTLLTNPRYDDPRCLQRHGFGVHSQYGEDGILEEILRRIGTEHRRFVEFGVDDGFENNTLYLLAKGWTGVWFEGATERVTGMLQSHARLIDARRLTVAKTWITPETANATFAEHGVCDNIDVLSIDIDGNDGWVWEAIAGSSPRVVAIEYNAAMGPTLSWRMPPGQENNSCNTRDFGSSLRCLADLGRAKGYQLVGCELSGVNAFFVRDDLVGDHFLNPGDAATHFEPPRYFLPPPAGHPRSPRELMGFPVT